MTQSQPIAIDHSQEKATRQVLPDSNLLCSCKTAWNGMYLEYHYSPSHETPEHYPTQHVIGIQTEGTVQAERKLDRQFRREHITAGDVCIVPAHTRHWIRSEGEQGLILISIDPSSLEHRLQESINLDRLEIIPHFAQPDPLVHHLGLSLKSAVEAPLAGNQFYAESLGVALAAHLVQYYAAEKLSLKNETSSPPRTSIQQALDYINDHLTDDLSLEAIATTIGMSQYHFCRVFKQMMGLTPWQYVVQQRIEAAKQLLAQPELSIAQISQQVGCANQNQFSTFFRKQVGVTPKQYRQRL